MRFEVIFPLEWHRNRHFKIVRRLRYVNYVLFSIFFQIPKHKIEERKPSVINKINKNGTEIAH